MTVKKRGQRFLVYRSIRQGGQVRSQYIGSGVTAIAVARQEIEDRIKALDGRQRDRDQERALDTWSRDVEQLARAILTITGHHRHHRGQWRRLMNPTNLATQDQPKRRPLSPEVEAIRRRVQFGDLDLSSTEARALMKAMPEMAMVCPSPAADLLNTLLDRYSGSAMIREGIRVQVEQMRADLAGPAPTAMEALLAERAAICWLAVSLHERAAETTNNLTLSDRMARERKLDGAHRRLMSAIKTLATVRKLQLPDVRIMVDQRSVHMANQGLGSPVNLVPDRSDS